MNFNLNPVGMHSDGYNPFKNPRTQYLVPKVLATKNWKVETDYHRNQTSITLEKAILTIELKYNGIENHLFKASILETSSAFQSSFTIIIEDTEDEDADGVKFATLHLDLSQFHYADSFIQVYERITDDEITLLARIAN